MGKKLVFFFYFRSFSVFLYEYPLFTLLSAFFRNGSIRNALYTQKATKKISILQYRLCKTNFFYQKK